MLEKLDIIIKNQEMQIALLQSTANGREEHVLVLQDMVPDPVDSIQQLDRLNRKLEENPDMRKKMVCVITHCIASDNSISFWILTFVLGVALVTVDFLWVTPMWLN